MDGFSYLPIRRQHHQISILLQLMDVNHHPQLLRYQIFRWVQRDMKMLAQDIRECRLEEHLQIRLQRHQTTLLMNHALEAQSRSINTIWLRKMPGCPMESGLQDPP